MGVAWKGNLKMIVFSALHYLLFWAFGFSCAPVNLGLPEHIQYFLSIVGRYVNSLAISYRAAKRHPLSAWSSTNGWLGILIIGTLTTMSWNSCTTRDWLSKSSTPCCQRRSALPAWFVVASCHPSTNTPFVTLALRTSAFAAFCREPVEQFIAYPQCYRGGPATKLRPPELPPGGQGASLQLSKEVLGLRE